MKEIVPGQVPICRPGSWAPSQPPAEPCFCEKGMREPHSDCG